MVLYTHWQSTAAYRMRIALNLKGISAKHVLAHLRTDGAACIRLRIVRKPPPFWPRRRRISVLCRAIAMHGVKAWI